MEIRFCNHYNGFDVLLNINIGYNNESCFRFTENVKHSKHALGTPTLDWIDDRFLVLSQVELRDLFRNQDATEFCVVTIPTQLAIAESKRLLAALNSQGVAVRNVVVNQVFGAI